METPAKKPSLLVIEDNPDTRSIYKDVFEREGFSVLLAEDGEKGLYYAQTTSPDVILLDLMLPKLSGFDILKKLQGQDQTKHIPVMVFSARDAASIEIPQVPGSGPVEYSAKVFNTPRQMVGKIRALLARSQNSALPRVCPHCHKPI